MQGDKKKSTAADGKHASRLYGVDRFRAGVGQHFAGRAIFVVTNMATILVLVRWMSVEDYANYTATTGLVTLITATSVLGIDRVTSRFLPEFRTTRSCDDVYKFVVGALLARTVAVALALFFLIVFWDAIARTLSFPLDSQLLYPILLYAFCLSLSGQVTLCLQSFMRQREIRVAISMVSVLRVVGIVGMAVLHAQISPHWAIWVLAISEMASLTWLSYSLAHEIRNTDIAYSDTRSLRHGRAHLAKVAGVNYAYYLIGQPSQNYFLKLVAAASLAPEVVAAFGFIHTLADRVKQNLPTHLFVSLIEPAIVSRVIASDSLKKANEMIGILLKINAMLLLPIIAWTAIAGSEVVTLLSGNRYGAFGWILPVFVLQALLSSHNVMLMLLANAADCSSVLPRASGLSLLLCGASTAIAFPLWGVTALVIGGTAYIIVNAIVQVALLRRVLAARHRYSIDWQGLCRLALYAAVGGAAGYVSLALISIQGTLPTALISGLIVAIVFYASCVSFKVFAPEERAMVRKLTGRIPVPV